MRRVLAIMISLFLFATTTVCHAAPRTVDLDTMTAEELQLLRDEVDAALSALIPTTTEDQADAGAIVITADELDAAYEANKIAADKQYKGKLLTVSGTINSIDQSMFGDLFVSLKVGGEWSFRSVTCYFGADQVDALASLETGTEVAITGIGNGYAMGASLKDCHF